MLIKDQSNFTSEEIPLRDFGLRDVFVGVTGPGPVAIQVKGEDGTFRAYPEATLNGPVAAILTLPQGAFRVVISGGPTTVQVIL